MVAVLRLTKTVVDIALKVLSRCEVGSERLRKLFIGAEI